MKRHVDRPLVVVVVRAVREFQAGNDFVQPCGAKFRVGVLGRKVAGNADVSVFKRNVQVGQKVALYVHFRKVHVKGNVPLPHRLQAHVKAFKGQAVHLDVDRNVDRLSLQLAARRLGVELRAGHYERDQGRGRPLFEKIRKVEFRVGNVDFSVKARI